MAIGATESEWEALPELEGEFEGESEWEGESEEFFRQLAGLAQRAARSPALRRVGLRAARAALGGLGNVGGALGGMLPQAEYEGEWEAEWEGEGEVNPQLRAYSGALMEHLGHAAAEAESEAEAEAFIGALIPLAAQVLPRVAPTVMRAAPGLIRGLSGVTRTLRRNPGTRPLVRTLPAIVRRTTATIARQAGQGRPVTPQTAVRTLARQTAQVLGSPHQCVQAYQRSRALDRRYHRTAAQPRLSARPNAAPR
jgi:hypothetical protein